MNSFSINKSIEVKRVCVQLPTYRFKLIYHLEINCAKRGALQVECRLQISRSSLRCALAQMTVIKSAAECKTRC